MPDGPILLGGTWPIDIDAAARRVRQARERLSEKGDPDWGPLVASLASAVNEIATLREEARRFYRADGSFELLDTAEEAIRRRKEAAKRLADHESHN